MINHTWHFHFTVMQHVIQNRLFHKLATDWEAFLCKWNKTKVENKPPKCRYDWMDPTLWFNRAHGEFQGHMRKSNHLNLSIPGNASQPLNWKSVHWADASTESYRGDSALVEAWNDSSFTAVHSQEKNFGTMWLLTFSWSMYLWTLQGKFDINWSVLFYGISSFI